MNLFSLVKKETEKLNIIGTYARLEGVSESGRLKRLSIYMSPVTVTYDLDMFRIFSEEYLDRQIESQEQLAGILEKHQKTVYNTLVGFEDKHRRQRKEIVLPKLLDEIVKLPLLPFRWALAKYVERNYKLQERSYMGIGKIAQIADSQFRGMIGTDDLKKKADKCAESAVKIAELSTKLANLTSHIPLRIMATFRSNYSYFMKQIKYEE